MKFMRGRWTTGAAACAGALVVAVVFGAQLLTSAGVGTHAPRPQPPAGVAETVQDVDDCAGAEAAKGCGNEHSAAVRAWVRCKADKGKDECAKPSPPGRAVGHTKHAGPAPGPASADGKGNGWGRAHAPGQLKPKVKSPAVSP